MAEEDLIFGKNRHMFGGIEPSNMKNLKVANINNKVTIFATLPDDTIIDGQTLCTVAGAVIRKNTTGYPKDEFDGTLVATITSSGTVIDTSLSPNTTYFYAAFPFTTQGVYNRSPKNRTMYTSGTANYLFGFDIDLSVSDSTNRVSYPEEVMNHGFTPAAMNFNTSVFNYGGWENYSTPGTYFMPQPCVLKTDGTVVYYLNPNDYTKTVDGASVSNSSTDQNFMMEWPKIYTHREVVNNVYKFRCSDMKLGEDWDCICNYDINNNEIDHFYTGIYYGVLNGHHLYSWRSNSTSTINKSDYFNVVVDCAKANGDDWNIDLLCDRLLIQDLLIMMAKTTDCKTAYGYGNLATTSSNIITTNGTMDNKGLFWGTYNDNGPSSVKVFGMENFWGNGVRTINGMLIAEGIIKVKLTSGTHDGTTVYDYNTTGDGYLEIADLKEYSSTGIYEGYISGMLINSFGRIPISNTGSNTTREREGFKYYISNTTGDIRYTQVGGNYGTNSVNTTKYGGLFYFESHDRSSDNYSYVCYSSLSCKPRRK